MERREFLGWVGVGCVASSLPVAIASCSRQTPTPTPSSEFTPVGTVSQLKAEGELLDKESSVGRILMVQNPEDPEQILAVNPTCTHDGCTVKWESENSKFICPCHDAEFSPNGEVLKQPAEEPLATYTVKVEGDSILAKSNS